MRSEAVVAAAAAERDVRIDLAPDVEAVGRRERGLVAFGRLEPDRHAVARRDLFATELDVARGRARPVRERAGPADQLVRGAVAQLGLAPEALELVRVLE